MGKLIQKLEDYLKETLGISVEAVIWEGNGGLPFYLKDRYRFKQIDLFNHRIVLMIAQYPEEETPATVKKHQFVVQDTANIEVVYVNDRVTSYNRKRLIEHKIPFIIPGNQMYLPMLAIDLREHFRNNRVANRKLSPSTQTVVFHALITGNEGPFTPTGLSDVLGYTPMTLTRAFDELESIEIGHVKIEGRERRLMLDMKPQELWDEVKEYLRNPIKRRIWIEPQHFSIQGVKAGLSALSDYTMLAEPQQETFAFSLEEWKVVKLQDKIMEVPANEPEAHQIEIWAYPPKLFATNNVVDRFSLYACLKDEPDERVQSMLDKMLEDNKW